ncbi:bifunctional DNA primase/polymerase [Tabrizicola soli]|uniref:Bifunctional DNA primase/polymerase n=1 Tax=Tabrizicola soli TaxID=2185115 RepID=A0ABV7DV88_9RHOB|nr:bifunctional DNA primase/polymerase [Tabrizicola soli]
MAWGQEHGPAQQHEDDTQAASGGPNGIGYPTYSEVSLKLLDNGYEPVPLHPGRKSPRPTGWSTAIIDEAQVRRWNAEFPSAGVGIRTGDVVGIDIDVLDPDIAHLMGQIVEANTGATLMRVGLWPKRLYLVRTDRPFAKKSIRKLEILGKGQQFVAFGIHPDARKPYYWTGETPLDVPVSDLPLVDEATCADLLNELAALLPPIGAQQRKSRTGGPSGESTGPTRNKNGLVLDGRDGWLSATAFHVVHDAIDAGQPLDAEALAGRVWLRFSGSTDLSRPKKDGTTHYSFHDALRKVRDKLSLHGAGRLPSRGAPEAIPVEVEPGLPLEEARAVLSDTIASFCAGAEAWLASDRAERAPRIGIRATVGLGKSAVSRNHLLALQARLRDAGLPHRIVVFVQSLALADEAAVGWAVQGVRVAVHRGYEATMPDLGPPMCRDLDMVRLAVRSGLPVFPNACMRRGGARCHNFEICNKQANLRDIEAADIVVAAYDSLFTGLSIDAEKFAVIVIDEGCWERAAKEVRIGLGEITQPDATGEPRFADQQEEERAWEELFTVRNKVARAITAGGPGPVARRHLDAIGLTPECCERAADLEVRLRVDPGLRPGLPQAARRRATDLSREANRSLRREVLFRAVESLLRTVEDQDGRIQVLPPDPVTGGVTVRVTGVHQIDPSLSGLPILHLDATLRTELAETVLPVLEMTSIAATAPHMTVTAVCGSFGKATLVEDPKASSEENLRRRNRLQECVDHVRWQAARVAPGRVLVVTYKQIEAAFAGILGVETGHFKAIAGLDVYKGVALLIVIGRPLPGDDDLGQLTSMYFGHVPTGGYHRVRRGLLMRDGSRRTIAALEHEDPNAELLRAAVCDDEAIQAIGRGRGVNRTEANPLEVQVLADVALPIVYDRVVAWDSCVADEVQRMLLAGVAVDSPADAAVLHPGLYETVAEADHAFRRAGFNRQNPIGDTYREMAVKSARYRRGGRGRSWQSCWWISGTAEEARLRLEGALGSLEAWEVA